ncbi:Di-sulfide bridge nucleocytoplasmic transport domain-containing protein [Halteromyces radiatus]|uniref:Di-sulfide bridge nucleocytoplasmic transport domain-containing protein n=1 Tax=Halteromyces radiatus TaxID=101107 RepID=UPI00221E95EA|nr:Di-sulfide bridge nucleocytoplasmic transport domain-containing protein [Halteromyces radiatus]KAI8086500.1 Di-sulfide bridge nucleocytoplasmic transport domain-containing protein [Halteromyces radiatus]
MQSSFSTDHDPTIIRKKRTFGETNNSIVPSKSDFCFTPTILPHQNIFNIDSHPSTWSASSLTHRYQQRLKARRNNALWTHHSPPSQQQQQALIASQPNHTSQYPTQPLQSWSNYLYHRSLSNTIVNYIQLTFSVVILSTIGYILFQLIWTLQQDFQIKADEYTTALIREIQTCAHQYEINLCHPESRIPAMEQQCEEWLICSNRMPTQVTRTKVSAETIAEIFNSFFDALSYKTMFFCTLMMIGYLLISSYTFRFFKRLPTDPTTL